MRGAAGRAHRASGGEAEWPVARSKESSNHMRNASLVALALTLSAIAPHQVFAQDPAAQAPAPAPQPAPAASTPSSSSAIESVRRGPLRRSGGFVVAPRCLHVHAVRRDGDRDDRSGLRRRRALQHRRRLQVRGALGGRCGVYAHGRQRRLHASRPAFRIRRFSTRRARRRSIRPIRITASGRRTSSSPTCSPSATAFEMRVFAGPSVINVHHDLVVGRDLHRNGAVHLGDDHRHDQHEASKTVGAFHVGLGGTYAVTDRLGVDGFFRFARRTVDLPGVGSGDVGNQSRWRPVRRGPPGRVLNCR